MQHEDVVTSVQFSPDGQLVLTASGADGTARLGDATSCKEIGELLKHGDVVHSAQFSPDGLGVVTASGLYRTAVEYSGNWRQRHRRGCAAPRWFG
jgi:WD40 repeat protein